MRPYDLLILGHHAKPLSEAFLSVEVLTHLATAAFRKLPHIGVHADEIIGCTDRTLPNADIILIIGYWQDVAADTAGIVKQRTGAIATASLREVAFPVDYSFVFKPYPGLANCTHFRLPCEKSLLTNIPKTPGTILVDHRWPEYDGTENGWTTRIEEWLGDAKRLGLVNVADPNAITRMIYYKEIGDTTWQLPPFITPLLPLPYQKYLAATAHFERFIATHAECYPYGVIDMAARGIQVLSPPGLLPDCIVDDLSIPIFFNKEELLALLNAPVRKDWNHKIDLCTDFQVIAEKMDAMFQERLATGESP